MEASLAVPLILLAVVAVLGLSLLLYQKSSLYYTAAAAAERTAYTWDNSRKDQVTGAFPINQNDGLYWRTGNDSLSDAFGFLVRHDIARVALPAGEAPMDSRGPEGKLGKAAAWIPDGVGGELSYTNRYFDRKVEVHLRKTETLPGWLKSWLNPLMDVKAASVVTEPVELIRTVDFVRTFVSRIKGAYTKAEILDMLPDSQPKPPMKLTSEKEAAEYLRTLVRGTTVYVDTPSEKRRKLDALDPDGLFHEAKFGYVAKTEAVERQIAKDLELMRSGTQVKGVVWHFFRDGRNGKIGPSKPLRKELEKRGIIVVIH